MNSVLNKIRFMCPACDVRLKALTRAAGRESNCPACKSPIVVPMALVHRPSATAFPSYVQSPVAPPPVASHPTVPVEIQMPAQLGAIKAQVSQETANASTLVVVGGAMVAIGVAVATYVFSGGRKIS